MRWFMARVPTLVLLGVPAERALPARQVLPAGWGFAPAGTWVVLVLPRVEPFGRVVAGLLLTPLGWVLLLVALGRVLLWRSVVAESPRLDDLTFDDGAVVEGLVFVVVPLRRSVRVAAGVFAGFGVEVGVVLNRFAVEIGA